MTVDGISDLDLSYTPPLGAPWDPVQAAAQAWSQEVEDGPVLKPASALDQCAEGRGADRGVKDRRTPARRPEGGGPHACDLVTT